MQRQNELAMNHGADKAMAANSAAHGTWYHQPVFWLGTLILVASLAGCIWVIMLATRHADEPLATGQPILFTMPTAQPAASGPPHNPPGAP